MVINNKWFTLKFFKLLWNKTIVDYWGIEYIEIIMYMTFFVSYPISTRYSHISLRAEGPRAEMGRGLIWSMVRKMSYHNLFIIYFLLYNLLFRLSICWQQFLNSSFTINEWIAVPAINIDKNKSLSFTESHDNCLQTIIIVDNSSSQVRTYKLWENKSWRVAVSRILWTISLAEAIRNSLNFVVIYEA